MTRTSPASSSGPQTVHLTPNGLQDAMAPPRRVPAWLMSLLLHASVLLATGFSIQFMPRGAKVEPDRSAGIVLVRQHDNRREYIEAEEQTRESNVSTESPFDVADSLPAAEEFSLNAQEILPSVDPNLGVGPKLPSAGELMGDRGTRGRKSVGGRVTTSVFGIEGEGTRFVYVFDRSGSMDGFGGRPLRAAKAELLASLQDLNEIHQFQIIFYNEEPDVFRPDSSQPNLVWADDQGRAKARRFVDRIRADGGTSHMEALRMALGMNPDVVFFLTDADEPQMTASELQSIRRLNRSATINTIEFGFGPRARGVNFLMRLANENGGRHAYVDVSRLRRSG